MANKLTKSDWQELIKAIGMGLLILFVAFVATACIALTIIGIVKGYL